MTPEMIAALLDDRKMVTGLFKWDFPAGARHLMLGSSEVTWNGDTYKGYDESFGSIDAGDQIEENADNEAPNMTVTVAIAPGADKQDVAGEETQLAPVKVWLAALELDANKKLQVVLDPELHFDGFIDQPIFQLDTGMDHVEYNLISAFDYFFEDTEGQRLSSQFHKQIWPGEKGLDNVTGVTRKVYWGAYGPGGANGGISTVGGSGGGLGGFILGGAVNR